MEPFIADLGLGEKEFSVYGHLNEGGNMSATELVKRTGIPSSKIYFILDSLIQKGLVSYHNDNRKKVYTAQHPNQLKELLIRKRETIENDMQLLSSMISTMIAKRNSEQKYLDINIYEGVQGIVAYHDKLLRIAKPGETVYLVGSTKIDSATLRGYFRHFHDKRVKKNIKYKVIKNYKAKEWRFLEDFSLTTIRYTPKNTKTPTAYCIFRNSVSIIIYNVRPTLIRIKNKELAESFMAYFDIMWELSKP